MLSPEIVSNMCHAEVAAWLDTVLQSLGVKDNNEEGTIYSARQNKPMD
ncbi:hypothetical protein PT286_06375 [Neisseriaceae bacterium ESL0693]|nr:hypothetical protein [Neisseriaceae bacterium ESL0693]